MSLKRMGNQAVDSWAVYYKFTTKMATKNGKSWFMFEVKDAGPTNDEGLATSYWAPTEDDFARGQALHDALAAGELKLATDEVTDDEVQTEGAM